MEIVCLDLEGVLVPEIWIAFAEETGIPELKRTTRDEPDYDKLMKYRIGILKEHGLGLKEIQETIAKIDPIPGAKEFLDKLRAMTQVIIISDTFSQFAGPLMKKLGYPTIFCNSLEVADNGEITGFKMRCEKSKYTTVKALQSIGYDTIASGDSHNDLGMIQASKAGFLFKSTDAIKAEYPNIPAYETYDELFAAIKKVIEGEWNRNANKQGSCCMDEDPLCAASFLLYRFLQYMCWERGYDKDKLRKVIGSWKKHNGGRYIGDVPQAIPLTGHRNKEHIA